MIGTMTRYFRTGPMTQAKREWIKDQIEGLKRANRDLSITIESARVGIACNSKQIELLERSLKEKID